MSDDEIAAFAQFSAFLVRKDRNRGEAGRGTTLRPFPGDDLLIGSYRLPFGPGGFERWASDNGLI